MPDSPTVCASLLMRSFSFTFIFLLFSILLPFPSTGSTSFTPNCIKARDLIFDLKIQAAQAYLRQEMKADPSNLIIYYLDDQAEFMSMLLDESWKDEKAWKKRQEVRLDRIDREKENSPWINWCKAEIYLHRAISHSKRERWIETARDLNRVYQLAKSNHLRYPDFLPDKKTLAILQIFFGSLPENFEWMKKLLGLQGDLDQGLATLWELTEQSRQGTWQFLHEEALILLIFSHMSKTTDKEAMAGFHKRLALLKPEVRAAHRPLLTYALASLYMKTARNDDAIRLFSRIPRHDGRINFYMPDYQCGIAYLQKLDTTAASFFRYFLSRHKGKNYVKSAWQKLGWLALIQGNEAEYERKMNAVRYLGRDAIFPDKQALAEAESNSPPDPFLIRARLLFDGGYYQRAMSNLLSMTEPDEKHRLREYLEYHYRLARIYHETNEQVKAQHHYLLVIEKGKEQRWYFAANAALMMGKLAEQNGNKQKALTYYEMIRPMKFKEYRNSILMKAREGIRRLGA
ncbi:MAG TPA: hypothetical protein P5531_14360 [Bacteroidales bacterium]|nr:hypothetical protein [Bacteroidales bacterium]HSA44747.1 hypothetical protein [Bacteroidales bacterium]